MRQAWRYWPIYLASLVAVPSGLIIYHAWRVPAAARAAMATATRLTPAAEVEFWLATGPGQAEVTTESAVEAGTEGLGIEGIRNLYPGWRVVSFTADRLILRQDVPELNGPLYLGLKNGQVAIFSGEPGHGRVWQLTGIRADWLLPTDRERLSRGLPVPNLKAAWQNLEGLHT